MKLPKEYVFLTIIGLFLLSYVLEAAVNPLSVKLVSPYSFLTDSVYTKYPFTAVVIAIRGLALFLVPLFLYAFFSKGYFAKASIALVLGALMQLYSLQEVATGTTLAPLEWSLSLSVAGLALLIPVVWYALIGLLQGVKNKINSMGEEYSPEVNDSESDN